MSDPRLRHRRAPAPPVERAAGELVAGTTGPAPPTGTADAAGWSERLDALLAAPESLRLVLHPLVDLAAARVAGHEVLSRVDLPAPARSGAPAHEAPAPAGPERWFDAARALGRAAELDALVLRRAVGLRARTPHGQFLTVNASPTSLLDGRVLDVLLGAGDLSGVVLEVTEHADCQPEALLEPLRALRARGAVVALDDVGTAHSGLLRMAVLRPEVVKVDLQLVRGLEGDVVRRTLVQLLGECAGRLDAWVVAEGVETPAELDVLRGMGVPLVQGHLLARPEPRFQSLSPRALEHLRRGTGRGGPAGPEGRRAGDLARRTKTSRSLPEAAGVAGTERTTVVVVDVRDVPVALVVPDERDPSGVRSVPVDVTFAPEDTVHDVAVRAVARAAGARFDPLVCTDATGRFVGVVGVEDVVLDLASGSRSSTGAAGRSAARWQPGAVARARGGAP
ncbi:EAL domain-containing protein [Kineococcus sp. SYSU DK004]|uniref:EAL domain-containing protein n=1 Tax=Kineococcus sp. SYSU DK004 TaxID=3383125 RepID=UPI003D7CE01A